MGKYNYRLIINKETSKGNYKLGYGNTKTARICVSNGAAVISVTLDKDYSDCLYDSYLTSLFQEGIKRSLVIHYLKYSRLLRISSVTVCIDDSFFLFSGDDIPLCYNMISMLPDSPVRAISEGFRDDRVIRCIVSLNKSRGTFILSSVYSYIYSKSKMMETEKLLYLWMSFNGMYSSINNSGGNDSHGIYKLRDKYNLGTESMNKADRDRAGKQTELIIHRNPEKWRNLRRKDLLYPQSDMSDVFRLIMSNIYKKSNNKQYDISLYGYLLGDFSYYLRCKMFHAEKPVLLFSNESDMELTSMMVATVLLEEFLDEYLPEYCIELLDE